MLEIIFKEIKLIYFNKMNTNTKFCHRCSQDLPRTSFSGIKEERMDFNHIVNYV